MGVHFDPGLGGAPELGDQMTGGGTEFRAVEMGLYVRAEIMHLGFNRKLVAGQLPALVGGAVVGLGFRFRRGYVRGARPRGPQGPDQGGLVLRGRRRREGF